MNLVAPARFWHEFKRGRLCSRIRQTPLVSLALELRASLREPVIAVPEVADRDWTFWNYETHPIEHRRFSDQTALLDTARKGGMFCAGLEIGCAAGRYTEVLAERCDSLLVLDFSTKALELARERRDWSDRVQFHRFDLRLDEIPGTFNLIVVTGVLEYFTRLRTLWRVREKLAAALRPGGYLLLESTRRNSIIEDSWWARRLARGKWINVLMSRHPALSVVGSMLTDTYAITLCRRSEPIPMS